MNRTPVHKIQSTSSTLIWGSALSDVAIQQAINVQILSQLSSISNGLNILEKKMSRKILIRKRKNLLLNRKPVVMLPWSHCPNTSVRL